jgi:RNA polymerase sigma-70 factor (ECF subfamily)
MSSGSDDIEDLFRKESSGVRALLIWMGASPADVDEYVNDGFLAVVRKWPRLSTAGHNPAGYARRAALHAFYKACRNTQREVPGGESMDSLPALAVDPLDRLLLEQDHADLRRALDVLTPREREAVVLRHVFRCGVGESAEIMGVSVGAVKRYTFDGLRRLRVVLTDENGEGEVQ